jgi:hypothetical protein
MTLTFRFASKSIAMAATILFALVNTSCVNGRVQPSTYRILSDDEKNQVRQCKSVVITGYQSYQLFKCDYYPECYLLLGRDIGKKLEIRDPYPDQIYQPKVTFDDVTKKYSFSFADRIEQPKVENPDLTIDVSAYQEVYGGGIYVGPGFSDDRYVSTSVRVTITHKTLGILFQGRFRAHPVIGFLNSPTATGLEALAVRIQASPVGDILRTALADDN